MTKQYHVDLDMITATRLEVLRSESGYGHGFISAFLRRAIRNQIMLEEKHGGAVVDPTVSASFKKDVRGASGDLPPSEEETKQAEAKDLAERWIEESYKDSNP